MHYPDRWKAEADVEAILRSSLDNPVRLNLTPQMQIPIEKLYPFAEKVQSASYMGVGFVISVSSAAESMRMLFF